MNAMTPTPTRVKKAVLGHAVTIEATFGSDHQRAVAVKVLKGLLTAWKVNVESNHKKNAVTITHETLRSRQAL
jgi:hypothetical protein